MNEPTKRLPVICIDGPSASGKGTLASALAKRLNFHYLDSGALYRLGGLVMRRADLQASLASAGRIAHLVKSQQIDFVGNEVFLNSENVTTAIRSEAAGLDASQIGSMPEVRNALLSIQREHLRFPGLVADGRDMGTVIFPNAKLKVFLTASAVQRAQRRYKQLTHRGETACLVELADSLKMRDVQDSMRAVSPLAVALDARMLDNSDLSVSESLDQVLMWWAAS